MKKDTKKTIWMTVIEVILCSGLVAGQTTSSCHFIGPVFPPPTALSTSSIIQDVVSQLNNSLHDMVTNGIFDSVGLSLFLQVFSAEKKVFDFGYNPTNSTKSPTSGTPDENSIFRIGSVSKMLFVYTLLVHSGLANLHDPVTKWVPELAAAANDSANLVEKYQWDQITIGALASHLAGINRGMALIDLVQLFKSVGYNESMIEALGLPALQENEKPTCGPSNIGLLKMCSREAFFSTLATFQPVTSPYNMPIYSNVAFEILGFAIEAMTQKSFSDSISSLLLDPLGMDRTYVDGPPPNSDNAVIPVDETASWWNVTMGVTAPVVDLYAKDGGLGFYRSLFVLSPDHKSGFSVLMAGPMVNVDSLLGELPDLITEIMVPAFEAAARQQATDKFAGTYVNSDTGMRLTLETYEELPGLRVLNWTMGETDMLESIGFFIYGMPQPVTLALYSMDLEQPDVVAFRGVYELVLTDEDKAILKGIDDSSIFLSVCAAWGGGGLAQVRARRLG
ncbi:hypothetical protein ACHAQH_000851 [Verticillium albo-atrum]